MYSAEKMAAPNSPASTFALHQRQLVLAANAESSSQEIAFSTSAGNENATWGTSVNNAPSTTDEFANFQLDSSGRLVTWVINGSKGLAKQIQALNSSSREQGMRFRLSTRYLTVDDQLQITYVGSSVGKSGDLEASGYITPTGKRKSPMNIPYRLEVDRRSKSIGASIIDRVATKGELVIEFDYEMKVRMSIN